MNSGQKREKERILREEEKEFVEHLKKSNWMSSCE